jgi:hypothetical protein
MPIMRYMQKSETIKKLINHKGRTIYTLIDDDVNKKIKNHSIFVYTKHKKYYAVLSKWNKKTKKTDKQPLHRFITNCPKGMEVDHINGDTLDNRRSNLRICLHRQNIWGIGKRLGNNKYIGVRTKKYNGNKYESRICGKVIGYFKSEIEAAKAYDKEALIKYGKYAKVNTYEK